MNKLFKKTLKSLLLTASVVAMFSTIQNVSAQNIQTVLNSKYGIPYLALTAEEATTRRNLLNFILRKSKKREPILADLVLQRANKICQNEGYHSAVDFDFETGSEKTLLIRFDDDNIEQTIEVNRTLNTEAIGSDILVSTVIMIPVINQIIPSAKYITNRRFLRAFNNLRTNLILGAIAFPTDYALSYIFYQRIEDVKLEGYYKRYYLYFTHIDCLEAKGNASAEQINETKLRYSCNVLQDNNPACNEASVREVSCLVSLSSKDDSSQTCKDLAVNIQDDKEFQCAVADIADYELPAEVCSI